MRRGAPNCIRMNPRSRCASGMLGSSSTVYNEQPTSAEMLPSRTCTERGYGTNIQQFDQNPTYKRVCRAHPHTYGKTPALTSSRLSTRAHPRTYGEHLPAPGVPDSQIGSSPHIRGTQVPVSHVAGANRLIPAHTGNTHSTGTQPAPKAAHPRTYGEHLQGYRLTRPGRGSSPHIRGTPDGFCCCPYGARLIPAHTGNTAET